MINLKYPLIIVVSILFSLSSFGQYLEQTECGVLTVNAESSPANDAYHGGFSSNIECVAEGDSVFVAGARMNAYRYQLIRQDQPGETLIQEIFSDDSNYQFEDVTLENGRYYVRIGYATYTNFPAIQILSCSPIGTAGIYTYGTTNVEIVGGPEISVTLETSFCCGEDVMLYNQNTIGEDGYRINICQVDTENGGCANWRSSGWQTGDLPYESNLLDIWNNNGNSEWIFWSNYSYRVTVVVGNECDSWVYEDLLFTVTMPDASFVVKSASGPNGIVVQDGGAMCNMNNPQPTLNASNASCGTKYVIMICQYSTPGGECLNWRSTGWQEGDVSELGDIDLLDIWTNNGLNNWAFWPDYYYRVSLALSAPCDSWEASSNTFFMANCIVDEFDEGKSLLDDIIHEKKTLQEIEIDVYPTIINNDSDQLIISSPELSFNLKVSIYNLEGKMVKQQQFENGQNQISVNELNNGVYFITISDGVNILHRSKFVVSKN